MTERAAAGDLEPLILDLVEWVAREPRTYAEVMDAWRTSCPRLTVWEDAVEHGLVARASDENGQRVVTVTAAGRDRLAIARTWRPLRPGAAQATR